MTQKTKNSINKTSSKQHKSFLNAYAIAFLSALVFMFLYIISPFFIGQSNYSQLLNNKQETLKRILPSNPIYRLPIDTSKIINDEDGLGLIVSDRINIALKDKAIKLEDFAIDLKKEFPDSTHKIIYYDVNTSRIQLQFPEEEKNNIKNNLKNKLSKYKLLIWNEAIFKTATTFNDPSFREIDKCWYFSTINAYEAWNYTTGDTSVIIAIIDDGFDLKHDDLKGKNIYPYNVRTQNKNVFATPANSHGTHVAGIAVANCNNSIGTSGIAPNCSLMPIQIANDGEIFTSTDVIDGILYAIKNKADVINLSLGKQFTAELSNLSIATQEQLIKTTSEDEESFWKELFDYADSENVTIVIAAGNQNISVGIDPIQRSNNTIKVSAIDQNNQKADFSNFGRQSTISAPGVAIYNCLPQNKFDYLDGTSMAAPIVTGAIGLMKSINPKLTNQQIIAILRKTSKNVNSNNIGALLQLNIALQNVPK
jgi:subtilisin family serine protease